MTDSRPAVRQGRAALPAAATGPLLLIAGALAAVLLAVSARYGYHRDELYFLAAGRHLAWGYPDQPPLTPALAALVDGIAPDSLVVLRVLPALTSAATVLLTGLLARELGGGRGAQLLAAGSWAVSAVVLITGHMFSTTAFDLLAWVATTWVAARLLRGGDPRWWLGARADRRARTAEQEPARRAAAGAARRRAHRRPARGAAQQVVRRVHACWRRRSCCPT